MKTKSILICLFMLISSAKVFSQSNDDSTVIKKIDPALKERSDDPNIEWRKISKKDLLAVKHIEDLFPAVPPQKSEIISCKVTFDGDDVPYFEYDIKGNEFSEAVLGYIEKSPEGTKIMIEFIKASLTDGTVRALNPVNLLLTE
jgi:hypothetical protein